MKKYKVFEIVIWSVLALFLCAFLIGVIASRGTPMEFLKSITAGRSSTPVVERSETFDGDGIDSLDIHWIQGRVVITPHDGEDILLYEKISGRAYDTDLFQIEESNGTLYLKEKGTRVWFFGWFRNNDVYRELKVPKKVFERITLEGTSGTLDANGLEAKELNCEITSGKVLIYNARGEKLVFDMTSGYADITGEFDKVRSDSTSGSVNISLDRAPENMEVEITSGEANVTIPDNDGFTAYEKVTSGSFRNDFETDSHGKYKDGSSQYSFRITSGTIRLKRQ